MSEYDEADNFFGGAKSFSFKDASWRGKPQGGRIIEPPKREQQRDYDTGELEYWPAKGSETPQPKWQVVVTIDTTKGKYPQVDPNSPGDDGVRRLFIKGQMSEAVRTAFRKVGAPGLRVGGDLYVAWTSEEKANNPKLNDKKLYTAAYTAPDPSAVTDDVFNQGAPSPTPDTAAPASTPSQAPATAGAQPDPFATTPTVAAQAAAPNPFA